MEPDLTIDLNLHWGDLAACIEYVGNQNHRNLISITVIFQLFFTVYCFYNSVYPET